LPCGSADLVQIVLTYVDQYAIDGAKPESQAWITAVSGVGEPFRTGFGPTDAPAFFAERGLGLRGDESTADAAECLGIGDAHAIPGFYRLATVAVEKRPTVG
jgi:hypothetical protein